MRELIFITILIILLVGCAPADMQSNTEPVKQVESDTEGDSPVIESEAEVLVQSEPDLEGSLPVEDEKTSMADEKEDSADKDAQMESDQTVREITIDASNWKFSQTAINVNKGDLVKLTVTSSSGIHGFVLSGYSVSLHPIAPGDSKTIEFVADKEGSFDFFCNVPCGRGHRDMTGKFIVN